MEGIYVVAIEALPSPGSDAFGQFGGAYVNVYILETSEATALANAQREVSDAGWSCKAVDKVTYVTRDDFKGDSDGLDHFEQALEDGVVVVFHTFPIEPDEDDVVH